MAYDIVSYGNLRAAYRMGVPLVEIIVDIGGKPYRFPEVDRCDDAPGTLRLVRDRAEVGRVGPEDNVDLYAFGITVGNENLEYLGRFTGRSIADKLEEFKLRVAKLRKKAHDTLEVLADSEVANESDVYGGSPSAYLSFPDASELVLAANEIFK
ncbi:MAG: hypothetical protein NT016_03560 [Candidatus Aenigmarchaeota archaeon]|nr:hypothetical protein [Candidatus Aenigmarchaeota archaeon]